MRKWVKRNYVVCGDFAVRRRAVKKAVRRMRRIVKDYEIVNAEKLAMISLQEEYLDCITQYIKRYHKDYYNSIHRERQDKASPFLFHSPYEKSMKRRKGGKLRKSLRYKAIKIIKRIMKDPNEIKVDISKSL